MKRTVLIVAIAMIAAIFAVNAFAIPAKPGPRTFTQPDGSTFMGVLKGDEHYSFGETMDGMSIMRNSTGWWTFARQADGLLAPSTAIVGRDESPYPAHLRPNAEAVAALPENQGKQINISDELRHLWSCQTLYGVGGTKENPSKAASGRQYMNVLLGDFTDSTFAFYSASERNGQNPYTPFRVGVNAADDQAANLRWFNYLAIGDSIAPIIPDSSSVGSMSNYFYDFTYRKAWWYGTVAYGSSGRTRAASVSAKYMTDLYINGVIDACDGAVDYGQNPGGGQDNLIIVHPGPGQEESQDTRDIWSYSGTGNWGTHDGVAITRVIACPQNGQLGVFCHEMFHQVGGPDLYDYGYSGTPYGDWSLMDGGANTGVNISGDAPAFPGALLTYDIDGRLSNGVDGWLTQSDTITQNYRGDGEYTIAALDSAGEARRGNTTSGIRLWRIRNKNFLDSSQYWFVELRRRTPPYEIGLPEDGLIITHLDARMIGARYNNGPGVEGWRAYAAWVEQPGFDPNPLYSAGDTNYPRSPSNAAYSADDYSGGGYMENRIDSTSIPNSWINKCYPTTPARTGPWIYDVSREGPTMSFNVLRTGMAAGAPLVSFQTATVLDPVGAGANNNNGLLDPWETDSIKITFLNSGTAITAGAQCSLYVVSGSQWVSLTPGWKAVGAGAIAKDAQAVSDPFVVTVSQNTPRFTDILFAVKFKSTTPAATDTSNFTLRISPFNIVQTYDFSNIAVGGSGYSFRIQPCDLAVYRDTLYVANADLHLAAGSWNTRIHKVRKNASTPLVPADTFRSINNRGATQDAAKYLGGIDVDNNGNLWYSIQDSCFNINRTAPEPQVIKKFALPNVSWGGSPMKRIRGVALGPSVVDTVGTDPLPGDSLWAYWQQYNTNGAGTPVAGAFMQESLYVIQKVNTGSASSIRYRYGFADSAWGAQNDGAGYNWWNGRALEYDGSNIWTSSVWQNVLIRRNATNARVTMVLPGPSEFGVYGTYGMAYEATDAAGVPYAPSGTVTYVPYKRGNKHYLYCASMDEGKIYKILATDFFVPTACDSVKSTIVSPTVNKIKFWKHNADTQKVVGYLIYRRADGNAPTHPADSYGYKQSSRSGSAVAAVDSFMDNNATAKAMYFYTVVPLNFSGEAGYGAASPANPLAVELTGFSCSLVSGNAVTLRWSTGSESDISGWIVERSPDGVSYAKVGSIPVNGPSPMGNTYTYTDQLDAPGMYYYRIADVSLTGYKHYSEPLVVTFGAPAVYALGQNRPNPVGPGATAISYALKAPGRTSLVVYNVLGEKVRTLVDQHQGANYYTVRWDGRNDHGDGVSNGVYFYKLSSGDYKATKKLMVLR